MKWTPQIHMDKELNRISSRKTLLVPVFIIPFIMETMGGFNRMGYRALSKIFHIAANQSSMKTLKTRRARG